MVGLFTILISITSVGPYPANAATVYDDLIKTTDSMPYQTVRGSGDLTDNWYNVYLEAIGLTCDYYGGAWCSAEIALQSSVSTGDLFVSYTDKSSSSGIDTGLKIFYSPDTNGSCEFITEDGVDYKLSCSGTNFYRLGLNQDSYNSTIRTNEGFFIDNFSPVGVYNFYYYGFEAARTGEKIFFSTFDTAYPEGYEGELIPDESAIDNDDDGLNIIQELQQGTSDGEGDSDGDGIDDMKESEWFVDRDEVFCDSSTPKVCAYPDPTVKDIYVEIDWMQDSSHNFKPSSTQKALVVSGLDDQSYNVHIDTGEYGGGNALSYITDLDFEPTTTEIDFFDLKDGDVANNISANFNPERKDVWRYLISGYNYDEHQTSSGASFPGSDNVFVSYGMIDDNPTRYGYADFDTAIAGTIVHELGHSLCLSDLPQAYSFQAGDCMYDVIDDFDTSLTYDSVMNYSLQMFQTHLSDGDNGIGDYNDWNAIDSEGIDDFSQWTMGEIDFKPGAMHSGITMEQAEKAKKKGTLGKVKRGDEVYDYSKQRIYNVNTRETRSLK